MTINSKTTVDQINIAGKRALGLRIRDIALKVWGFILSLVALNLLAVLLAATAGMVFLSLLYLLENLIPIA